MKTFRLNQVLALLSALFCLFVLRGEAHAVTFDFPGVYGAGTWSLSGTTGDFNGDGKLDLAVANMDSDNVSILLGKGDGTFNAAVNYAAGDAPHGLVTGDFNRDGNLDIAVTNYVINKVSVLLGNGDGTFGAAVSYSVGSNPSSVTAGDFNGDGIPDLAVANCDSNNASVQDNISILLGIGDGTFNAAVNYAVGNNPYAVTAGDFNRDGILDLAVAHNGTNGRVSILPGNGDGTFNVAASYPTGIDPWSVAAGDFNRDGILDLAVPNSQGNDVSIFIGKGDGTFNAAVSYGVGNTPVSVAIGDFDGDGKIDLAMASHSFLGSVAVLTGNGDGTFNSPLFYNAKTNSISVTTGDFNRDGIPDLAVFGPDWGVAVLLNTTGFSPSGIFNPPMHNSAGTLPMWVVEADFNRDGIPDLAVVNFGSGNVSILIGKGDGRFYAAVNYAAGTAPFGMTAGDFNRDGIPDLAVTDLGSNRVSILIGKGDGTFNDAASFSAGFNPYSVTAGDFNRDGIPDLVVTNYSNIGSLSVLLGNGDGSFNTPVNYAAGGSWTMSVIMGDFNGDGRPDLAVTNNSISGTISVLLGNGDGTFIAAVSYGVGSSPYSIAAVDFNRDGIPDLAVANYGSGNISVLIGKGDGTFYAAVNYAVEIHPQAVTAGDFNRDGKPDLAVATADSGNISILYGKGDGTFNAAVGYGSSPGAFSITAGDFNRDGKIDLAVATSDTGKVSILLNSPPTSNLTVTKTGTGTGSVINDPAGTDCGTGCRTYDNGTVVTLTATVDAGSTFGGWTGCTPDLADPLKCTITMNTDSEVSVAFDSIITVTSPNGGETWDAGDRQTISWTYIGNPGAYVKIELLKAGVLNRTLASYALKGTGGVGSFTFTLPSSQTPGSDYTVRITSRSNVVYTDTSDNPFTINAPTITVASPNGGEIWDAGTTQTVSWTYTGNPGSYVSIELLKGGVLNRTLGSYVLKGTGGVGSYTFKVPLSQAPGSDYTVRITSRTNGAYTDTSDNPFTINAPTITVASPNGGETWDAGTSQTVRWTYTGTPGSYVRIELLKGGVLKRVIAYGAPMGTGGNGLFSWPIPSGMTFGTDYTIRIRSTTSLSIGDTSGSFTISPVI